MHGFARSVMLVAVALAGVASAQPIGVIDPWERTNEDAGAEPAAGRSGFARSRLAGIELEDPWATVPTPVTARSKRTDMTPVVSASAPFTLIVDTGVIDPWASSTGVHQRLSLERDAAHAALARSASWYSRARATEILDPWLRPPAEAATRPMPLVLDPWAR